MTTYESNRIRLAELRPEKQFAAFRWLDEAWATGLRFHITEAFRTQARQDALYAQGRTVPGRIVTWTRNSEHTRRLAADVYMDDGTYAQLDAISQKYGIIRPPALIRLGDLGHHDFSSARIPASPVIISPQARLNGLIRRLKTTKLEYIKPLIAGEIERLTRRLGL